MANAIHQRIRKLYVDVPMGQVNCRMVDGRDPAILFLHQSASSSLFYEPLMAALKLPNRLLAIDTPGFGESFNPDPAPTLSGYSDIVVSVADALGIVKFHVFGHHTGATIALDIAARYPYRAQSIVLVGPQFMTDEERVKFSEKSTAAVEPQPDGSHLMVNWSFASKYNPDCDPVLLNQEVVAMLHAWRGRAQAHRAVADHDSSADAQLIRGPVLLLTSPDDFFHPILDRAQALLPQASVAVTGGGNFQPAAASEEVARAVEAFVGSVEREVAD